MSTFPSPQWWIDLTEAARDAGLKVHLKHNDTHKGPYLRGDYMILWQTSYLPVSAVLPNPDPDQRTLLLYSAPGTPNTKSQVGIDEPLHVIVEELRKLAPDPHALEQLRLKQLGIELQPLGFETNLYLEGNRPLLRITHTYTEMQFQVSPDWVHFGHAQIALKNNATVSELLTLCLQLLHRELRKTKGHAETYKYLGELSADYGLKEDNR